MNSDVFLIMQDGLMTDILGWIQEFSGDMLPQHVIFHCGRISKRLLYTSLKYLPESPYPEAGASEIGFQTVPNLPQRNILIQYLISVTNRHEDKYDASTPQRRRGDGHDA